MIYTAYQAQSDLTAPMRAMSSGTARLLTDLSPGLTDRWMVRSTLATTEIVARWGPHPPAAGVRHRLGRRRGRGGRRPRGGRAPHAVRHAAAVREGHGRRAAARAARRAAVGPLRDAAARDGPHDAAGPRRLHHRLAQRARRRRSATAGSASTSTSTTSSTSCARWAPGRTSSRSASRACRRSRPPRSWPRTATRRVPHSLTLMAGPIDARVNPTIVNDLAAGRSLEWFERNVIGIVPRRFAGAGRRVYPGFVQVAAFMRMNPERHRAAFRRLYDDIVAGNDERAVATKAFYDEYFAVLDLTAEFYLETIARDLPGPPPRAGRVHLARPPRRPRRDHADGAAHRRGRARRHLRRRPDRRRARPVHLAHAVPAPPAPPGRRRAFRRVQRRALGARGVPRDPQPHPEGALSGPSRGHRRALARRSVGRAAVSDPRSEARAARVRDRARHVRGTCPSLGGRRPARPRRPPRRVGRGARRTRPRRPRRGPDHRRRLRPGAAGGGGDGGGGRVPGPVAVPALDRRNPGSRDTHRSSASGRWTRWTPARGRAPDRLAVAWTARSRRPRPASTASSSADSSPRSGCPERHRATVEAGRLHRLHRGVYAVGHPLVRAGRWLAAVLACGPAAVLSHASAAELWGIRAHNGARVEVTVVGGSSLWWSGCACTGRARCRPRSARSGTRSRSRRPARTVLDLAPVLSERALERLLDRVEVERLTDVRTILATVAANHGHHGCGPLRRTLAQHVPGTTLTRSRLEERVLALCRAAGLPRPLVNHPVLGLEVDFVFPGGVLVEADSWRYHHRPAAFARDRERDGILVRAGYRILRFADEQIIGEPGVVARTRTRQQGHDPGRVQIHLSLGVEPPPARTIDRARLLPADALVLAARHDQGQARPRRCSQSARSAACRARSAGSWSRPVSKPGMTAVAPIKLMLHLVTASAILACLVVVAAGLRHEGEGAAMTAGGRAVRSGSERLRPARSRDARVAADRARRPRRGLEGGVHLQHLAADGRPASSARRGVVLRCGRWIENFVDNALTGAVQPPAGGLCDRSRWRWCRPGRLRRSLPASGPRAAPARIASLVLAQAALGITTLLAIAPLSLGLAAPGLRHAACSAWRRSHWRARRRARRPAAWPRGRPRAVSSQRAPASRSAMMSVDVLDADREAHHLRAGAGLRLLLIRELAVRGRGRMDDQRARVADIGEMREQLEVRHQLARRRRSRPCRPKVNTAPAPLGRVALGERVVAVALAGPDS